MFGIGNISNSSGFVYCICCFGLIVFGRIKMKSENKIKQVSLVNQGVGMPILQEINLLYVDTPPQGWNGLVNPQR